jgi:hypothetical protein
MWGRGEAVYLIGCVSHAIYTPTVRMLNRGEGPLAFTFITVTATAMWTTAMVCRTFGATDWAALRPLCVVGDCLYCAVCHGGIKHAVGDRLAPPACGNVMAYTYLVPSWVIVGSVIAGLPGVPAWTAVGVALTLRALVGVALQSRRQAEAEAR